MPVVNQSLWPAIRAFELDEPGAAFPFTARLAAEQGWSHAQAARVVAEYKRFLLLAVEAGHPVTPSEAVDQAWHLHLVYTRSYWQRLCRETLGKELHHSPTAGGGAELEKFCDWYARTLESYARLFGEAPPGDIWPEPEARFSGGGGRWVERQAFWLVPRPRWTRRGFWQRWRGFPKS